MFSLGKYFILAWRAIEHIHLPWYKISCDIKLVFKGVVANILVESKNTHYSCLILQSCCRFSILVPTQLPGDWETDLTPERCDNSLRTLVACLHMEVLSTIYEFWLKLWSCWYEKWEHPGLLQIVNPSFSHKVCHVLQYNDHGESLILMLLFWTGSQEKRFSPLMPGEGNKVFGNFFGQKQEDETFVEKEVMEEQETQTELWGRNK